MPCHFEDLQQERDYGMMRDYSVLNKAMMSALRKQEWPVDKEWLVMRQSVDLEEMVKPYVATTEEKSQTTIS